MVEPQGPMETPYEMISTKRILSWDHDIIQEEKYMVQKKEERDQDSTPTM